jgi:hypothetical protein
MRAVNTDRYKEARLAEAPNSKLRVAGTCWYVVWYLANVSEAAVAFKLLKCQ